MQTIIFATGNKAKLNQMRFVAQSLNLNVKIVSLKDLHQGADYEEMGNSAKEIAIYGAKYLYQKYNLPVITEDSITEVECLNNLPGINSKKFLKQHGRQGLIEQVNQHHNRTAKLSSVVAYYDGKNLKVFENIVPGSIATQEAYKPGEPDWVGPTDHIYGGGFNAVFIPENETRTLAEMTKEEGLTRGYREPNFKQILLFLTQHELSQ